MMENKKPFWKNLNLENIVSIIDGVLYAEEWKDIEGYELLYKISSFGRVKILGRRFIYSNLGWITTEDRIMKLKFNNKKYTEATLSKNGKSKSFLSHRLVSKAFHKNKYNKETVNHKDGNRSNNFARNLEWNTQAENLKHSFTHLGRKPSFQTYHDENHPMARAIRCTTLDIDFKTMKEACNTLGVNRTAVYKICSGKIIHTKGLSFMYL